jgi:hypothetical protein
LGCFIVDSTACIDRLADVLVVLKYSNVFLLGKNDRTDNKAPGNNEYVLHKINLGFVKKENLKYGCSSLK